MRKPLCIDLYAGLGGWAEGFLSEGYDVVGFDIERHVYGAHSYPGQLVLQNVLTLEGSQFKGAAVIVASPPCQEFSRYAMPFGALWREHQQFDDDGGPAFQYQGKPAPYTGLFWACFRIAREAGVPLVVENVKGAERFAGSAKWHFGSYYLWGDVPALMPMTLSTKRPGRNFHAHENGLGSSPSFNGGEHEIRGVKRAEPIGCDVPSHDGTGKTSWFYGARSDPRDMRRNENGEYSRMGMSIKQHGSGPEWWDKALDERRKGFVGGLGVGHGRDPASSFNSRFNARKAASAMIAKIPFELSAHIARCFKPAAFRQENLASF
jgi:hypothetical protein